MYVTTVLFCFNSKLVRLKVYRRIVVSRTNWCFNSKLVRLKEVSGALVWDPIQVSIPNWFD